MNIRVVVSGRDYDLAKSLPRQLTLPEGASLDQALEALAAMVPEGRTLAESCLVAVSGVHLGTLRSHRVRQLADGEELLILAPVAGG